VTGLKQEEVHDLRSDALRLWSLLMLLNGGVVGDMSRNRQALVAPSHQSDSCLQAARGTKSVHTAEGERMSLATAIPSVKDGLAFRNGDLIVLRPTFSVTALRISDPK
jgi:hypothetical protein